MARGGKRDGAGRKLGIRNKRTERTEQAKKKAAELIKDALPEAFEGGAHDYLMAVYKNPLENQHSRIDAAKAALPYEKPRLGAIQHTGKDGEPIQFERIERTIVDPQDTDG